MATTADRYGRPLANTWMWTAGCGVLLIIAGILSIAAPGFTTAAIAVLLAWLLLFAGIGGVALGLRARSAHERWTDLLYGIGSIAIALFVLFDPVAGAASLTIAFAIWLGFRGAVEFGGARRAKPGPARGVLLLTGAINWLLAILLIVAFPFPAIQMLGLFVGVSLLLGGAVTLLAAFQLRRIVPA